MAELKGRTLNLSVWHHDPVRRNVFLGEVEVGLADWDWGQTEPTWRPLLPRVSLCTLLPPPFFPRTASLFLLTLFCHFFTLSLFPPL